MARTLAMRRAEELAARTGQSYEETLAVILDECAAEDAAKEAATEEAIINLSLADEEASAELTRRYNILRNETDPDTPLGQVVREIFERAQAVRPSAGPSVGPSNGSVVRLLRDVLIEVGFAFRMDEEKMQTESPVMNDDVEEPEQGNEVGPVAKGADKMRKAFQDERQAQDVSLRSARIPQDTGGVAEKSATRDMPGQDFPLRRTSTRLLQDIETIVDTNTADEKGDGETSNKEVRIYPRAFDDFMSQPKPTCWFPSCSYSNKNTMHFWLHITSTHGHEWDDIEMTFKPVKPKTYTCPFPPCAFTTDYQGIVKRHMRMVHGHVSETTEKELSRMSKQPVTKGAGEEGPSEADTGEKEPGTEDYNEEDTDERNPSVGPRSMGRYATGPFSCELRCCYSTANKNSFKSHMFHAHHYVYDKVGEKWKARLPAVGANGGKDELYSCEYLPCAYTTYSKAFLVRHMSTTHEAISWPYQQVLKGTGEEDLSEEHPNEEHPSDEDSIEEDEQPSKNNLGSRRLLEPISCKLPHCSFSTHYAQVLPKHMNNVHHHVYDKLGRIWKPKQPASEGNGVEELGSDEAPKSYSCEYPPCAYTTTKESGSRRHMARWHGKLREGYRCEFPPCTFSATRQWDLRQHMTKRHGYVQVERAMKPGFLVFNLNMEKPALNGNTSPARSLTVKLKVLPIHNRPRVSSAKMNPSPGHNSPSANDTHSGDEESIRARKRRKIQPTLVSYVPNSGSDHQSLGQSKTNDPDGTLPESNATGNTNTKPPRPPSTPQTLTFPPLPHLKTAKMAEHFYNGFDIATINILEGQIDDPSASLLEIVEELQEERPVLEFGEGNDHRYTVLMGSEYVCKAVRQAVAEIDKRGMKMMATEEVVGLLWFWGMAELEKAGFDVASWEGDE